MDKKRNGVGVILKVKYVKIVVEVKRAWDRVMSLKLDNEGKVMNVLSG